MQEDLSKEYERIKKYASKANAGNYEIYYNEISAIINCSPDIYDVVCLAFAFGFAKACRKAKRMQNT